MHGMDRKEYRDHSGAPAGKGDHGSDSSHLYGGGFVASGAEESEDLPLSVDTGSGLCGSDDPAKADHGEASL